jgi:acetylornithine deacetylase/succinyl-diaminopimelate desuccinylase-like protein
MDHMAAFAKAQEIKGCTVHALSEGERTPFLIVTVDASECYTGSNSVLMYGHLDKQPFGEGWIHDPCDPVIENGKLNGRGSSDDCYAFYSALLSIKAC